MLCFLCERSAADAAIEVSMSRLPAGGSSGRTREYRRVTVPVCCACKAQELSSGGSNATIALIIWVVLVIAGGFIDGWPGGIMGFAFGFVVAFAVTRVKKPNRALLHEDVKALEKEGFRAGA